MAKNLKKILILGIVALGVVAYYKYNQYEEKHAPLVLYGNVDIRDVVLGFRVAGRIDAVKFEEGDRVEKGAVLATLDKAPFEAELKSAEAELADLQASLAYVEKEYKRQKSLLGKQVAAQKDYENALSLYHSALAKVNAAKAHIDQATIALSDTKLKALETGIILTRIKEPGSIITAGTPVFSLSLESPVWVRTYVDEPHLGQVHPGQKVTVKTDGGHTYEGQIGFISPQAEFTPKAVETTELRTALVYRLRIIIKNPDKHLRQGMPVTSAINGAS